ncbi:MAG TPA: ATP-binding protein [Candidatus Nanoarchaeia archaeon]|nr:ATP-binding protein [Candidatus Nanoarchaeia archaeon]
MKEVIKQIIKDFHSRGLPQVIQREINIPLNSNKVISIIGARRSGKTYLMYQTILKLKDITNVIYINFEDERLELTSGNLNIIIESYFELYPNKREQDLFFFFDEIQEIKGWERFIRRLYDTITKNIFITGSSSKLLSKEIAASLRGRTITFEVYPLSFKEYLKFKNVELDSYSTKGKAKLISNLNNFILKGGFPEVINMEKELYEKSLESYFEVMIYRDVAERYSITNILSLKLFIKRLISNTSREFSVNKIFSSFKSEGVKISKDTLYKFLDYCEDAYILMIINSFSESLAKQTIKKSYSIDTGLSSMINFTLSRDIGRLFENVIMLELKRRFKEIFYYKEKYECDFIIKEKDKIIKAIQVCYNLNDNNLERELTGLKEAMKKFNIRKGIILTLDLEKKFGDIEVIPAYKWLLKSE